MIGDIKIPYFSICRILLLIIGLWPYQQSRFVQLQIILVEAILTSGIMVQLTTFITIEYTMKDFIKILSSALPFFACFVTYNLFCIKRGNMKYLLEQLQHIYNQLKDKNEISIIEKYGCRAKRYTNILTMLLICSLIIIIILPIYLHIERTFSIPINSSPRPASQIMTEYFIDQEKYFYLIILHIDMVICTAGFVIIAIITLIFIYFKHFCGIFRIASYRIEQAMTKNMLKNISLENEIIIRKRIIYAIDMQRRAMKLSLFLTSSLEELCIVIIIFVVSCLTLNLLRIFQILTLGGDIEELLLHILCVSFIFPYLFISCYIGQDVTDHNNQVFITAYNVRWYKAPLRIQRLILLLLQRNNKIFNLTVGSMFTASLECFATLTSASLSYCTVIYSMQQ